LPVLASTPAVAARTPTTRDAKRFVAELNAAFKSKNVSFLVGHLHPAVISRYGRDQCRSYLTTLVGQSPRVSAHAYGAAADYVYTSDGLSTTVPDVVPVNAMVMVAGRSTDTTVHVTRTQWFTDCGNPVGAAAAIAAADALAGHYVGNWHNDRFATSGSLVLDISVDPNTKVVHATVALGGNVFGASAPPPETIDVPIDVSSPPQPVTATSKLLGPLTVTVQADHSLVADAHSVPGGVLATMHATLARTATGLAGSYALTFAGSPNTATGTVEATKS
jgi:hypothetical protein